MPILKPRRPKYYIRMFTNDRWYLLMTLKYSRVQRRMQPLWVKESAVGDKKPYLYKTVVSARAGIDRYVSPMALLSEVVFWKETDATVQTDSH